MNPQVQRALEFPQAPAIRLAHGVGGKNQHKLPGAAHFLHPVQAPPDVFFPLHPRLDALQVKPDIIALLLQVTAQLPGKTGIGIVPIAQENSLRFTNNQLCHTGTPARLPDRFTQQDHQRLLILHFIRSIGQTNHLPQGCATHQRHISQFFCKHMRQDLRLEFQ